LLPMLRYVVRTTALSVVLACGAAAGDGLLLDCDFAGQGKTLAPPWEVRFGLKASEPGSRPRWVVRPRRDADGKAYVSCDAGRPAAGTVLIGQPFGVPEELPPALSLGVTFQSYCSEAERSGSVAVGLCRRDAWEAISAEADTARPVLRETWLYQAQLHPNKEDVTDWRTRVSRDHEIGKVLTAHAGEILVAAVFWTTWHPGAKEWFRLQRVHLGEPGPWLEWVSTPTHAVEGEPFAVSLRAHAPPPRRVEAGIRLLGSGEGDWRWVPCQQSGGTANAPFHAILTSADQVPEAVRARLVQEGDVLAELPPQVLTTIRRPTHPCVFYTPDSVRQMKERITQFGWAGAQFDRHRKNAETWLTPRPMPVIGPGGWSHDYVCPKDGARLKWREDRPTQHLCSACNKEWSDAKRDAFWRCVLHGRFASGLRDLGLCWQVLGDQRFADAGKRLLLWYADNYAKYPEGRGPAGRGRVMSQSLSECSWLIRMVEGADLLFPALSPPERRRVEEGLFQPGVEQIRRFRFGIHNIQCWHNACMATVGYFLGDPRLVEHANDGKLGFRAQVEKGILDDGMWFERSLGYHNYTLSALIAHCEAARNNGTDLYRLGRIQAMFTVPLRMAQPNLVPPSLNDQGYKRGRIGTLPLELAWAWYDDQTAAGALRHLYASGAKRRGLHLLKHGKTLPDNVNFPVPQSVSMPGAGLAILRLGGKDGLCAMLEYGEHGGGHGHPDRLQLILYGLGQTLCPDLETTGYGVPLHSRWYKTSPAHNTVTIGSRNQSKASGRLLGFETGGGWAAAAAETPQAYKGWVLRRSLFLTGNYLIDCFEVTGSSEDVLDWFLRAPGGLALSLPEDTIEEEPPNKTYAYLTELEGGKTGDQWSATWTLRDPVPGTLTMTMAAVPGTEVVRCRAPGLTGQPPWHTLRVRRRTAATRFVAVYQVEKAGMERAPVLCSPDAVQIGGAAIALPNAASPIMHLAN